MIFIKDRNSHERVREYRAPSVLVGAQFTFELNQAPIALLRCNIFFRHTVPSGSPFWRGNRLSPTWRRTAVVFGLRQITAAPWASRRGHAACMNDITFRSRELHRRPHLIARLMSISANSTSAL